MTDEKTDKYSRDLQNYSQQRVKIKFTTKTYE